MQGSAHKCLPQYEHCHCLLWILGLKLWYRHHKDGASSFHSTGDVRFGYLIVKLDQSSGLGA